MSSAIILTLKTQGDTGKQIVFVFFSTRRKHKDRDICEVVKCHDAEFAALTEKHRKRQSKRQVNSLLTTETTQSSDKRQISQQQGKA